MRIITPILFFILFMGFYIYMPHYDMTLNTVAIVSMFMMEFFLVLYYARS